MKVKKLTAFAVALVVAVTAVSAFIGRRTVAAEGMPANQFINALDSVNGSADGVQSAAAKGFNQPSTATTSMKAGSDMTVLGWVLVGAGMDKVQYKIDDGEWLDAEDNYRTRDDVIKGYPDFDPALNSKPGFGNDNKHMSLPECKNLKPGEYTVTMRAVSKDAKVTVEFAIISLTVIGINVAVTPDGAIRVKTVGTFAEKDWLGIYKKGDKAEDPKAGGSKSIVWWYLATPESKNMSYPSDSPLLLYNPERSDCLVDGTQGKALVPGEYFAVVLANDGYTPKEGYDAVEFTVPEVEGLAQGSITAIDSNVMNGSVANGNNGVCTPSGDVIKFAVVGQGSDSGIDVNFANNIDTSKYPVLALKVRNNDGRELGGELFYNVKGGPTTDKKLKTFRWGATTDWQWIYVDFSNCENVGYIRFDMFSDTMPVPTVGQIAAMMFFESEAAAKAFAESDEGKALGSNPGNETMPIPFTSAPQENVGYWLGDITGKPKSTGSIAVAFKAGDSFSSVTFPQLYSSKEVVKVTLELYAYNGVYESTLSGEPLESVDFSITENQANVIVKFKESHGAGRYLMRLVKTDKEGYIVTGNGSAWGAGLSDEYFKLFTDETTLNTLENNPTKWSFILNFDDVYSGKAGFENLSQTFRGGLDRVNGKAEGIKSGIGAFNMVTTADATMEEGTDLTVLGWIFTNAGMDKLQYKIDDGEWLDAEDNYRTRDDVIANGGFGKWDAAANNKAGFGKDDNNMRLPEGKNMQPGEHVVTLRAVTKDNLNIEFATININVTESSKPDPSDPTDNPSDPTTPSTGEPTTPSTEEPTTPPTGDTTASPTDGPDIPPSGDHSMIAALVVFALVLCGVVVLFRRKLAQ